MHAIKTFVRGLARLASAAPETVLPYAITRAAMVVVGILAAARVPFGDSCHPCDLSSSPLLSAFSRWDGRWYLSIARYGYSYVPGTQSNVVFSPLLPLLMRGLASLTGHVDDDVLVAAGLVVTNAALLAALFYLLALGRSEIGVAGARRSVLYLLLFPTSVFLSALYPESLLLACALGALVEARRGRWPLAGVLAALAALSRPFGVLLAIPLAMEALARRARRDDAPVPARAPLGAAALAVGLPVAAFVAWCGYLYRFTGDALAFVHAEASWSQRPGLPVRSVADLLDPAVYGDPWIVAGTLLLVTVCVVVSWRMLRPSTAAYGTVMLIAALSSGTLTSFPRYALEVFPAFLVLGAAGRWRPVHLSYVAIGTALSVLLAAMFASWYWIG